MTTQLLDCYWCGLPKATMRDYAGIRIALCPRCDLYVVQVSRRRKARA